LLIFIKNPLSIESENESELAKHRLYTEFVFRWNVLYYLYSFAVVVFLLIHLKIIMNNPIEGGDDVTSEIAVAQSPALIALLNQAKTTSMYSVLLKHN
jgi:hypothetical protein